MHTMPARRFAIVATDAYMGLKTQMKTRRLARTVACDLVHLWDAAIPQNPGRYASFGPMSDRELARRPVSKRTTANCSEPRLPTDHHAV